MDLVRYLGIMPPPSLSQIWISFLIRALTTTGLTKHSIRSHLTIAIPDLMLGHGTNTFTISEELILLDFSYLCFNWSHGGVLRCVYYRPFHHISHHHSTSHYLFLDIIHFIFASLNCQTSCVHWNRTHFQWHQINKTTLHPCRSARHVLSTLVATTCGFPQLVAPNTSPMGREGT